MVKIVALFSLSGKIGIKYKSEKIKLYENRGDSIKIDLK